MEIKSEPAPKQTAARSPRKAAAKGAPAAAAKRRTKPAADAGLDTQAAAGLVDPMVLDSPTGLASELAAAAEALSQALETGHFCEPAMRNLGLWVAVKTLANGRNGGIDPATRADLNRIADQVAATTFAMGQNFTPDSVLPLIAIDLEASRALVDGLVQQMIRERAYFLWQESGSRHGNDQGFWFAAEREIREAMCT